MALPSAWAKSLFPLDQRHCHWRKWHIKETVFREDSDGGIHILHKRHIASIEPVCTSTDVPSRFFVDDDVVVDDDDDDDDENDDDDDDDENEDDSSDDDVVDDDDENDDDDDDDDNDDDLHVSKKL